MIFKKGEIDLMGILNYEYFFKILIFDFMQSINNKIFKKIYFQNIFEYIVIGIKF